MVVVYLDLSQCLIGKFLKSIGRRQPLRAGLDAGCSMGFEENH
jgi:hypothetical protein